MKKFKITEKIIKKIFLKHKLDAIINIEYIKDNHNPCAIINNKYVLRINSRKSNIHHLKKEVLVMKWLKEINISIPNVYVLDETKKIIPYEYIIMSKIDGREVNADWNNLNKEQKHNISFQAGKYLAEIHKIKFKKFGDLKGNSLGEYSLWCDYLSKQFDEKIKDCLKNRIINKKTAKKIKSIFTKYESIFKSVKNPVLIHNDYHFRNILYKEEHISGILDFELAIAGDSEFDMKNMQDQFRRLNDCKEDFMKGYLSKSKLSKDYELKSRLYKILTLLELNVVAKHFWKKESRERIKKELDTEILTLS